MAKSLNAGENAAIEHANPVSPAASRNAARCAGHQPAGGGEKQPPPAPKMSQYHGLSDRLLVGGNRLSQPLLVTVLGIVLLETVSFRLRFASSIDAVKAKTNDAEKRILQSVDKLSIQTALHASHMDHIEAVIAGKLSGDSFLKDQSEYESLAQITANATEIIMVGTSMVGLIGLYAPTLRLLLRRGCKIQVVLRDPLSLLEPDTVNINRTLGLLADIRQSDKRTSKSVCSVETSTTVSLG